MMFTIAAALLSAAPADVPTITVNGRQLTREAVRSQARSFVNAVTARGYHDQYSRWNTPICPVVIGVAPEVAKIVTDKIRAVAADAGAKLAKAGCEGNTVVVFTDDARAVYAKVAARNAAMFVQNDVKPHEHQALSKSAAPVRWWYSQQMLAFDGMGGGGGTEVPALATAAAGPGFQYNNEFGSGAVSLYNSGSMVRTSVRIDVRSAVAIVDVKLASGVRLDALAAYVALMTLSAARFPAQPVDVPSITNLFSEGKDREADLTDWDRALLKALYKVPASRTRLAQRGAITREIALSLGVDD